jgi:hypothetical protein
MPRGRNVLLQHQPAVRERRRRFPLRRLVSLLQLAATARQPHPSSPSPAGRLQQHGIAQPVRRLERGGELVRLHRPRNDRDSQPVRRRARGALVAQGLHGFRRGPDEHHAGGGAGARKRGALGEKSVSGMERRGPALFGGADQGLGGEITLGRPERHGFARELDMRRVPVGIREDGHRGDLHLVQGAQNPAGNLPAVGDENLHGQLGFLFSKKAARPSCASGVTRSSAMVRIDSSIARSLGRATALRMRALATPRARGAP